jgi:hypothetical protein
MNQFSEHERKLIQRLFEIPMHDYFMKSFIRIWKQIKTIKFVKNNDGAYEAKKPFDTEDIKNVTKMTISPNGNYYLIVVRLFGDGELPMVYHFGMKD